MTEDTTPAAPTEAPQDPNAPKRRTLPSGKVVEVRSHRTLLGQDIAEVLASQPGGGWAANTVGMRNELMRRLIIQLEPGRAGTPALNGTVEAVLAQRADDYRIMYSLVEDAMSLSLGISVIPDLDEWEDPKAPTTDTSDSRSDSEDAPPL